MHADFNRHERLKLDRRVNTFVYMNEDWPDAFGGHLELWNRRMDQCVQRIAPVFNRLVVFSTTDFTYHGHPEPLACPAHRSRRSFALYFYTNGRPAGEEVDPRAEAEHSTLYVERKCASCLNPQCQAFLRHSQMAHPKTMG